MSDFPELVQPQLSMPENFYDLNARALEDGALRLCEIADFAHELASALLSLIRMDVSAADGMLFLKEYVSGAFSEIAEATEGELAKREELRWQLGRCFGADAALLVHLFLKRLPLLGIHLSEEAFAQGEDVAPIYAYVKNALSDEAYEVITENVPDARVRYVSSFAEGAKLLVRGEVGYCLFPIEEKGDMRLPTVENLLSEHKLSIHRILPVFGFDGLADLKYALVSKGVHVESYQKEDDRYLEFDFELTLGAPPLGELLSAIDLFGLSLYRIHTKGCAKAAQNGSSYTLVVRSQGTDFLSLIVYLTLFFDSYRIIGIYKNLEA